MIKNKQFELEVLNHIEFVIAEFDKDNYHLNDEDSAKALTQRLNELYEENKRLKNEKKKLTEQVEFYKGYKEDVEELTVKQAELETENKELKDLLKSIADKNDEIWLHNGQIIRLKKVFKGE